MDQKPPRDTFYRFYFFWILAGLLETPAMFVLIANDKNLIENHFGLVAVFHILAAFTIFFALPRSGGWFHPARLWGRIFAVLTIFLPVFGWIISGLLYLVYRDPEKPEDIFEFEKEEAQLAEPLLMMLPLKENREDRLYKILDFMPLADILAGADANLKRGAIEKLARLATPESLAVLLDHRSDPHPEVRFYVTSALTSVKKKFDEELEAAKRQLKGNFNDVNARFELARMYLRYARSGLLDGVTAHSYENEAFHHLDLVTGTPGVPEEAYVALIGLCKERARWDLAIDVLKRYEACGYAQDIEIEKIRIEIYYGAGHFGEVKKSLKKLNSLGFLDPDWVAAAYLWGAV